MKTIKKIRVTVKYTVSLGGVEVTDEELKAIKKVYNGGGQIDYPDYDDDSQLTSDLLMRIIREDDCLDHMYEIDNLEI